MTTIETDNPIIEIWVKYYDILWHYWLVVLLAFILVVWLMFRHFSRSRWNADGKRCMIPEHYLTLTKRRRTRNDDEV